MKNNYYSTVNNVGSIIWRDSIDYCKMFMSICDIYGVAVNGDYGGIADDVYAVFYYSSYGWV